MIKKLPLALSQGDPAGIGPEIALKAWVRKQETGLPAFIYLGDPHILNARAQALGIDVRIETATPETACSLFSEALPVFVINTDCSVKPGIPGQKTAQGTIAAIEMAVELTLRGKTSAVVTNPISKSVLYRSGFGFPGHTEFLAELIRCKTGAIKRPVMLLSCSKLKVVPVTIHIPLADVPKTLTTELIVETARITANDLSARFNIATPRLAFSGLNPHAGEDSTIGSEDEDVIRPALEILLRAGINVSGPLPADTMFHAAAREKYDVAICMYHDQALIPVKTLGFEDGVNVTLGLPFVRTSPDHGTAFDIASKGIANPKSLEEALKLADSMTCAETAR